MSAQPKPFILIVEDEVELAQMISEGLEAEGMMTQVFHRASPVLRFLKNNFANLLLLDIHLPDATGFAILQELKNNDIEVPSIFLTANSTEVAKVRGLDMGGDDYITKPFSFPELVARIRAVLRRAETFGDDKITKNLSVSQEPFRFCRCQVNPERLEINFPDGACEKIGRKEMGILAYLHANPGTVLTRRSMIHSVWGIHADVRSRSLDQYVVKIRNLFTRHACDLSSFRTVHGVGYMYEPTGEAEEG